jgi:ABC-type nitrate/sulfonate/bicarbonate transport system substrate-binding protein
MKIDPKMKSLFILVWLWLMLASPCFAAGKLDTLTVGYSSFSGAYVPLWIAVEEHLGRRHGLDLKAIYAGRIRPQQLLASGEVPYVIATGTGALTSHILGVKDQEIILTFINKVNSAIFARSDIKSAEDLRGKTIATGRPGAFGDTMVRYVLRAKLGLVPDRDVKLLPVGEAQLAFPALERGVVQAASLTLPFTLIAKKMGYREVIDYDSAGVVYPYNTVTTLRQTPGKNPELAERFLKTMIEGIHIMKTDKPKSLAVMKKYMRGATEDILEETFQYTSANVEQVPTPRLDVIKAALDILSYQFPQAKETDANLIIDASYMKRVEQSGFIRALYKK